MTKLSVFESWQDVEKVPYGGFSTTNAENAISVLLTKSTIWQFVLGFGRPSMGSIG